MSKKVVVFGGGTGITQLLLGLKLFPVDITAVVSVADDGKSTGKLREEFHIPAVGDIRNVIVSLSDVDDSIKKLLQYRFNTYSDLNGHPIGNLIMTSMYDMTGSLKKSIDVLSKFLNVKNTVLPLSEDCLTLAARTDDGEEIVGQAKISHAGKVYDKLYYLEEPHVLPEVVDAIINADMIIFSIGSLFTSIMPHIIAKEVVDAIDKSKAKILYTANAVTQPGETNGLTLSGHVKLLNKYLGKRKIDTVIAANTTISEDIVMKYSTEEQKDLVVLDKDVIDSMGINLILCDMLTIQNSMIRHDSLKLATCIFNELMR